MPKAKADEPQVTVAPSPDPATADYSSFYSFSTGITIVAFAAVILLLRELQQVLIPLVLASLLFYALDPVVDWLHRLKIPRAFGAAIVVLTVVGAVGWTVYSVRDEAIKVVEDMPKAAANLRNSLRPGGAGAESTLERLQKAATEIDKTTTDTVPTPPKEGVVKVQVEPPPLAASDFVRWGTVQVLSLISAATLVLMLAYFLLVANDLFKRKLIKNFGDSLSRKKITVQIVDQVGSQIGRFLLVQVFTSTVVAVVTGLALSWLGVEQAAFWGIAAGVLNSIPYFGPLIVTTGLSMIGLMQFGTLSMAAAVGGTALLITTLEGWFLTPGLMGRAAQMNQVAVFVSLIFWSWLWGVWGLFLAIPMMMMVKSVCDHIEDLQPWGDFLGE